MAEVWRPFCFPLLGESRWQCFWFLFCVWVGYNVLCVHERQEKDMSGFDNFRRMDPRNRTCLEEEKHTAAMVGTRSVLWRLVFWDCSFSGVLLVVDNSSQGWVTENLLFHEFKDICCTFLSVTDFFSDISCHPYPAVFILTCLPSPSPSPLQP